MVPPAYILLPISYNLPEFTLKTGSEAAKATWWQESDAMAQILARAATQTLSSEQDKEKYLISGELQHVITLYGAIYLVNFPFIGVDHFPV